MLTTLEKVDVLRKASPLEEIPTESLARLAAVAREITCPAHEALFQENAPAYALYVVVEGQMELRRGGKLLQKRGAFQALGALALLAEQPYTVSAVAGQAGRVLRIERSDLYEAMAEDFSLARGILRKLSRLATTADEATSL